jgi:hypothetical protein
MHDEQLEPPENTIQPEAAAVNIADAAAAWDKIPGFDFSVIDRLPNPAPDAASAKIHEIKGNRRDGTLAVRDGGGGFRAWLVAGAIVVTFCVGWLGGSHAYRFKHLAAALNPYAPPRVSGPDEKTVIRIESPARIAATKADPDATGLRKLFDSAANTAEYKPFPPRHAALSPSPVVSSENAISPGSVSAQSEEKVPPRLTPVPETRPGTIEGWTVRRVDGGTAVLEGPGGVWQARQGDTVPGVGRIDSIVLWGGRWIVATATGLIATQ